MMTNRGGFTLIELLVAVTIVGTLSAIAVPKYREFKRQATATQIVGDYDVVRHAAMSFYVDSGYFPAEVGAGKVPKNLKKYLPASFIFRKPQWTLDYENWSTKTQNRFIKTGIQVGLSFTTTDKALGQTAMKLLQNNPTFTVGKKYTVIISGL
jgi:prepilin-type N-terminal cleavage/methylation domain-containing protein